MTRIVYGDYGGRYYFEASGHAVSEELIPDCECDEKESELVCAAISILVFSAYGRLSEMQSSGDIYNASLNVENGYACFDLSVRDEEDARVSEIFEVLMSGFMQLEEKYPELISCD